MGMELLQVVEQNIEELVVAVALHSIVVLKVHSQSWVSETKVSTQKINMYSQFRHFLVRLNF